MRTKSEINLTITDRSKCFYWQTDRDLSAEEAAMIWKDRHSAITNEELLEKINKQLTEDKLAYIQPIDEKAQISLGNVNSIRVGVLENGKEVIIRCHPKGIKNGYFSETPKYENFVKLFQLFRLRYTILKMALRMKKYTYEQTPFLKGMIEIGKKHLEELCEIFDLNKDIVQEDSSVETDPRY